eukprot:56164-Chlamydomonas_euryale.AAC.8
MGAGGGPEATVARRRGAASLCELRSDRVPPPSRVYCRISMKESGGAPPIPTLPFHTRHVRTVALRGVDQYHPCQPCNTANE